MMQSIQSKLGKNGRWLLGWVGWPIGAYLISWVGSAGFIVIYPTLLTVAQWYVLKKRPDNQYPAYWFFLPISYIIVLAVTPQLIDDPGHSFGYLDIVCKFYLCQCAAELLLFRMFATWRFGWYSIANVVAYGLWYAGATLGVGLVNSANDWNWLALAIPATAVLANTVTGVGLLKATGTRSGKTGEGTDVRPTS